MANTRKNSAKPAGGELSDKVIRIVARRDGFRRAGRRHSAEPAFYELDEFTEKQFAALDAEKELIVDVVDRPPHMRPAAEDGGDGTEGE